MGTCLARPLIGSPPVAYERGRFPSVSASLVQFVSLHSGVGPLGAEEAHFQSVLDSGEGRAAEMGIRPRLGVAHRRHKCKGERVRGP